MMGLGMAVAIRASIGKIRIKCSTECRRSHTAAALPMNLIDLEILIPASPEFIWRFLGDLQQIPRWQKGAEAITFLSTQREGRGARWRQAMHKGHDRVVEVSAWYDTLGYTYKVVDGGAYSDNEGQIKLREVPEGTLVRWTFQYEAGGMFGGLRNAVGMKGNAASHIQDSLRNLHQLIMQQSGGISTHEAKATMQEAPDVAERSSYEPRHPSSYRDPAKDDSPTDVFATEDAGMDFTFDYDMPPIPARDDSDTKPNPVALGGYGSPSDEDPLDDTQPVALPPTPAETPSPPSAPEPTPLPWEEPATPILPLRRSDVDTSNMSVFEIFGLQKPSRAALQLKPASEAIVDSAKPDDEPARAIVEPHSADAPQPAKPVESDSTVSAVLGARRAARRRAIGNRNKR